MCIGVLTPPLNRQTVQAPPFLGNPPAYILVFREVPRPPLKVGFFSEPPKYQSFSKNIFAYKLFLSLNISDFVFYVKIAVK